MTFKLRHALLAAIAFLALSACTKKVAPTVSANPLPPQIPIVDSWQDLLKTTPIGTCDDQVHIGIEALSCPAHTGVLIYCAPVNPPTHHTGPRTEPGDPLGPVFIRVRSPNPSSNEEAPLAQDQDQPLPPKGQFFFTTGALVGPVGSYQVQILNTAGKILAQQTITAHQVPLPWFSFKALPTGALAEGDSKIEYAGLFKITHEMGVPRYDGRSPSNQDTNIMPKLFPNHEAFDLTVSMTKGEITVRSSQYLDPDLESNWMIRWYVNDNEVTKPYAPITETRSKDVGRDISGPTAFSFHLTLDRKTLHAKPGDKITFDLLYSQNGFILDPPDTEKFALSPDSSVPVQRSNEVTWSP